MPFLSFPPALIRRRPGRVELSVPALVRGLYLGLGAILVYVLSRSLASGSPLTWLFGGVIALAAMSEDRWVFDMGSSEMRRRYGLLLIAKSWAIDLNEISAIELDADAWDSASADPFGKIPGGVRKGFCALRVILSDGRSLTMTAVPGSRIEALRGLGAAISETIGKPLTEA